MFGKLNANEATKNAVFLCEPQVVKHRFCPSQEILDDATRSDFNLKKEIKHRLDFSRQNPRLRSYSLGQVNLDANDLIYVTQKVVGLNEAFYSPDGNRTSKEWVQDLSRILGLHYVNPKVKTLLQTDLKRLVNYKIPQEALDHSVKIQEPINENDDVEKALKSTFCSDQVIEEDCTCFIVIRNTHYFSCKKYSDVRIHPHSYPPYRKSTIAEEMKKNRRAYKCGYSSSAPADLEPNSRKNTLVQRYQNDTLKSQLNAIRVLKARNSAEDASIRIIF